MVLFWGFAGGKAAAGLAMRSGWPAGADRAAESGEGPSEQRAPKRSAEERSEAEAPNP
ncbi:hypothetical protein SGRA_0575 [Saprospira grandis str. Lewin]|uniref:Uncharacterized protein n=1 Tax=Saprospira grandis (strain Lewin) TaxID=984262 RepID=H6KZ30_SAPGL|nr:hypothetical protein SGRA_0575 [Saprospira grandis str. Lewin]